MTALTAYLTSTTDTLVTTARQISATAPSSETSVATTCKKLTGWGELQTVTGLTAWPALGSEPAPSGNGSLYDVTTLEGQTIAAGTWTPTIKLVTSSALTAAIHVRAYKYNAGAYTAIGDWATAATSIGTTAAVYSPTATSLSAVAFGTGDKLYIDYVLDITVAGGSTTGTVSLYENGGANESVVTPGYNATPAAGAWSKVQKVGATQTTSANPGVLTSAITLTAGNLLIIGIEIRSPSSTSVPAIASVTDTLSNTYAAASTIGVPSHNDVEVWYATGVTGGATTVTITTNNSGAVAALVASLIEFSGEGTAPRDVVNSATSAATTAVSIPATAATTVAGDLVLAAIGIPSSGVTQSSVAFSPSTTQNIETVDTSTAAIGSNEMQLAWEVAGGTGTQSYTSTLSASTTWGGCLVTFKPSTAAAAAIPQYRVRLQAVNRASTY